jgi:hypothetical protein
MVGQFLLKAKFCQQSEGLVGQFLLKAKFCQQSEGLVGEIGLEPTTADL